MNKGLMVVVNKLTLEQRAQYEECKRRLGARTDTEAKACAEAALVGKHLQELPGKRKRRVKKDPEQGSLIGDDARSFRIHNIREVRLERWRLKS